MPRSRSRHAPVKSPPSKKAPRAPTRRRGKAIAGSDQHFLLLADSATEYAIFMLDAEGRVADWNGGARRIHGYEAPEIIGQHVGVLFTPEDRAQDLPARDSAGRQA